MPQIDRTAAIRLIVAVVQGLALFLLYTANTHEVWPATAPYLFRPLALTTFFVPLIIVAGYGNLRALSLLKWIGAATALIIALATLSVFRMGADREGVAPLVEPGSSNMILFVVLALSFLAGHSLITANDAHQKYLTSYAAYFDAAWKHALQVVGAVLFIGAFWLALFLGTRLFGLIGLDAPGELIEESWFAIPATTIVATIALHATDVRANLIAGLRTLALTLLSWLLPLLTVFVWCFLASLPFTGLRPLWNTNFAAALLLTVTAAQIILINAAYQDGNRPPPRALRAVTAAAAIGLAPLVVIAAYALALRVGQYGWTHDRVIAAACIVVTGGYAAGYGWAALRRGTWMVRLERCNIAMTYAAMVLAFLLFTPILDPARIATNSQIARLQAGITSAEQFDWDYVRFDTGRYGPEALKALSQDAIPVIRELAAQALARDTRRPTRPAETERTLIADNLVVITPDRPLPEDFRTQRWADNNASDRQLPTCMWERDRCDVAIMDLNADGADEVLVIPHAPMTHGALFARDAQGIWQMSAALPRRASCADARAALGAGQVTLLSPIWPDVQIGENRMRLEIAEPWNEECPASD